MPKNLILCCDGTNNQFESNNTNVVRIVQSALREYGRQHVYYDPGVGTFPEPGYVTWIGRYLNDLFGLAFGSGLGWKVQEAYSYLMDWWEPGDRVFLVGFSRGAYTVRVLAGLLHELGLIAHGSANMVPYALRLFATARNDRKNKTDKDKSKYWKVRDEFRRTFARPIEGDVERRFPIHFMGLFDTVASVGWVWDPTKFPFTTHNESVKTVRHAVSIDERRWFFRQNLMEQTGMQYLLQVWFPGVHCDVGGGYTEDEGGLWRPSFEWMIKEADAAGMVIDANALTRVLTCNSAPPANPELERRHESLTLPWWPAEFFPKLCPWAGHRWPILGTGRGRHRRIVSGEKIGRTALLRIREMNYAPPNLSESFIKQVKDLADIPEWLEYQPSP